MTVHRLTLPALFACLLLAAGLAPADDKPSWSVPKGWNEASGSPMRVATFAAGRDEKRVEIAVTAFPGDVGGNLANLNRWRMQVGLPPVNEEQMKKDLTEVKTAGAGTALVADLTSEDKARRLLGAIIPHKDRTFFVKALGPAEPVAAQKEAFVQFVKSFKFAGGGDDGEK